MTTPVANVVPIFATPFLVIPVGVPAELNAALAALFLERATEAYRDPAAPRDALCFRGREDLFEWQSDVVGELKRGMLGGVCAAVMAVNRYTEAEFDALGLQARARFVVIRPNGCLSAASAPLASWYAIYCVAAPPAAPPRADSAALRLYAIRDATMFMDAANCHLREPFSGTHYVWRLMAGQMAVFPASILHEIALNRADAELLLVTARLRFAHGGQVAMPPW
jgi:hypothetical protein